MESESFFKELVRRTLFSFCRVLAVGIALIILIVTCAVLIKKPQASNHITSAQVVPNHTWKMEPLSKTTPTLVKINIAGTIGLGHLRAGDIRSQLVDTIDGDIKQDQ